MAKNKVISYNGMGGYDMTQGMPMEPEQMPMKPKKKKVQGKGKSAPKSAKLA